MADRKISELAYAESVASGDVMVVVTGVGAGTLVTTQFPLSGLLNHIVNVDELVVGGTGIHLEAFIESDIPNQIEINVSGYAYEDHTHIADEIEDLGVAVSGYMQQIIAVQTNDLADNNATLVGSTDLQLSLEANSYYLCQLGTIFTLSTDAEVSGVIDLGANINNATSTLGTWSHLEPDINGHGIAHNTSNLISDYGLLVDGMSVAGQGNPYTVVNNFVVKTTNGESAIITFNYCVNNSSSDVVLKEGSWLKAEKII